MKRVLLVEAGGSHDECLYTQIHALREAGVEYKLAVDDKVAARLDGFQNECVIVRRNGDDNKAIVREIRKLIRDYQPDTVIFNTAQGRFVRDLALQHLFHKVRFVGLIHTTRKFKGSFTQKLINLKCKEYLFLADFLLKDVGQRPGKHLDFFYTLDFPGKKEEKEPFPQKRIAIIGGVEHRRKDLDGFVEMIGQKGLEAYRVVFLGKSDDSKEEVQLFIRKLKEKGLEDRVHIFHDFVSHDQFAAELAKADFILPLIHPETPSADQYFTNQIPGAMNVSLSWKIPMLLHEAYERITELQEASFYYKPGNFAEAIAAIDEQTYSGKVNGMKVYLPYQTAVNKARFMHFLRRENTDKQS